MLYEPRNVLEFSTLVLLLDGLMFNREAFLDIDTEYGTLPVSNVKRDKEGFQT